MATPAGPDVDVVVPRPDAGVVRCLDLVGIDPPAETAGGRLEGEEVVEGSGGVVATLWGAVTTEVGGACGVWLAAGRTGVGAGAPALTVVETWRLRS
ncbi:MAG TPA: hypothetical protein VJS45_02080 [Acidimicrobiia bacterium]|nr:hypothetical protein [Acidimicrobiia bacterium]